jgi:hypothetical protein
MKMGDWVVNSNGDIGRVYQRKPYEKMPDSIYIKWSNKNPSWVNRKDITPLTKEVGDILRSIDEER